VFSPQLIELKTPHTAGETNKKPKYPNNMSAVSFTDCKFRLIDGFYLLGFVKQKD